MITLLSLSCSHLSNHVSYVCFTTNLSLLSKKKTFNQLHFSSIVLSLLTLGLLIELENNKILLFVVLVNLNSLTKENFHRVDLIEAHNSICNYDLISVCETNLDDSVELPETLLNDYTFEPANHPLNIKHGGVGLLFPLIFVATCRLTSR